MTSIEYDKAANLLRVTVHGFLKAADVPVLASAVETKSHETRAVSDDFNVLVDLREFPVQSSDITDLLAQVMQRGMMLTPGRVAVVASSQLSKLQLMRMLVHDRFQLFTSMAEAQDWLYQKA